MRFTSVRGHLQARPCPVHPLRPTPPPFHAHRTEARSAPAPLPRSRQEIEFPDNFRNWRSCEPGTLLLEATPVVTTVPNKNKDMEKNLQTEARKAQWLILWLDCDREARRTKPAGGRRAAMLPGAHAARPPVSLFFSRQGEAISFEVMDVCLRANPRLSVLRARFSALTPHELHRALGPALGPPNRAEADAVGFRQELDLRLGAAFTRFQSLLLQDCGIDFAEFCKEDGAAPTVSYGPCQFPTLGFIADRHWQQRAHSPERFWRIDVQHRVGGRAADFAWARGRLFSHGVALSLFELCAKERTATVLSADGAAARRNPPLPLSTLELQARTLIRISKSWF